MQIHTIEQLWKVGINYTLDFETKMAGFYPEITQSASTPEFQKLARGIEVSTGSYVDKLRTVLVTLGEEPQHTDNAIAEGMIQATRTMIGLTEPGSVRDAAVIVELNQQSLYRVATYGSMLTYARLLERSDVAQVIEDILEKSKQIDAVLTKLAQETVNPTAVEVR